MAGCMMDIQPAGGRVNATAHSAYPSPIVSQKGDKKPMDVMEVVNRLQRVQRKGGNKWQASCPCSSAHSHDDKKRSLSVSYDDASGKILMYCHTGCSIENICAALGLSTNELSADTEAGKRASFIKWYAEANGLRFVAEYSYCYGPYHDGLAKLRFIDKEGEKDFRWIKADPAAKSGYKLTHAGCPNRLYICGRANADTVFLVEGEKDADTLYNVAGYTAVSAENGATKGKDAGRKWLEEYNRQLEGKTVYILRDNDDAGKRFAEIEAQQLTGRAAHVYSLDLLEAWPACPEGGDISDMAAALGDVETKSRLQGLISNAKEQPAAQPAAQQEAAAAAIDTASNGMGQYISSGRMQEEIKAFIAASDIKTNFYRFDKLAGGLYPGLYVIGAISSLGKTTFVQQLADNVAAAGKPVLFFSLEMSRLEMASKSISRKTAQLDYSQAVSSLKIRAGVTSRTVQEATEAYIAAIGDRMQVIEGGFDTTVESIGEYARAYIEQHKGSRPVIIVDYLQIIQGAQKGTVREAIDYNVVELKRLARSLDVPVIVISSINRGNYLLPVDFESFKESGGIEYTADVVLGLQLACLDENAVFQKEKAIMEKREAIKKAKADNPRMIKLVCLKNRYGRPDWTITYKYYPQYDYFVETEGYTEVNKETLKGAE